MLGVFCDATGSRVLGDKSPKRGSIHDDFTGAWRRVPWRSFFATSCAGRSGLRRRSSPRSCRAAARVALDCIGNSDALYHNVEHTLLVTLAGHDIFCGRALHTQSTAR